MPEDLHRRSLPPAPQLSSTHYNPDRSTPESGHENAWAGSLLRRFSSPPPYTVINSLSGLPPSSLPPGIMPNHAVSPYEGPSNNADRAFQPSRPSQDTHPSLHPELHCEHHYALKVRGKDSAALTVWSRAHDAHERPLLYFGDDVSGRVSIALGKLEEIQRIEVVLQEFVPGRVTPAAETRKVMLPSDVDGSLVRAGVVDWGFALTPALINSSPLRTTFPGSPFDSDPSGRRSSQLLVTVFRRGRLTQNAVLTQQIEYLGPSSSNLAVHRGGSQPSPWLNPVHEGGQRRQPALPIPEARPWRPQQGFPVLHIRGQLFDSRRGGADVDISVQLEIPKAYPSCADIPLRLALACADHRALDLLRSRPDGIDVRLYKVIAYGEAASRAAPLSLKHRSEFFRRVLVARGRFRAHEVVMNDARDCDPEEWRAVGGWRLDVSGELVGLPDVGNVGPTLEFADLAVYYTVVLFPFKVAGFKPTAGPEKQLFIAKLPLLPERL